MDFATYERDCQRTDGIKSNGIRALDEDEARMLNAAMGMAGEAGEIVDDFKKYLFHGHPFDVERFEKEVGDILWYAAQMARGLGTSLDEVARKNIEKLRRRYPDGFSSEASINRQS